MVQGRGRGDQRGQLKGEAEFQAGMAELYHERQQLYRCGIHALNNALQERAFSKEQLDAACDRLAALGGGGSGALSWAWNPHRAPLGLGNYDVNALMLVLEDRGYSLRWVDKRQPVAKQTLDLDAFEAVLCNVVLSGSLLRAVWETRHWFAIRKIDGVVYNLDSKLDSPKAFESEADCYEFLQQLVDTGECELFAITRADDKATSGYQCGRAIMVFVETLHRL